MTQAKKKSKSAQGEAAKNLHPFAAHIQKLEDLRQPWNPVVRAAIELLRREKSNDYCDVVQQSYGYAETVQQKGMWQCSKLSAQPLSNHAKRNAICIVLGGRVEVIGRQTLPTTTEGRCSVSPAQPRHMISMEKGEILGAYEFTGNLFQHPETHEYEVLSGPVCIQFDHNLFNLFKQNKTTTTEDSKNLAKCAVSLKNHQADSFREWWKSGENYHLIKAFASNSAIQTPHSELLFIDLKFPYLDDSEDRHAWEAFRNAVVENAWRQSRASRGRAFKASSVASSDCPEPVKELKNIEIESYKASLVHLDEAINGVGALWTESWDIAEFPSIESFLQCSELNDLGIKSDQVFIKEPLFLVPNVGRLSVVDFLAKYSRAKKVGKIDSTQISGATLTAWVLDDPLANAAGITTLTSLRKHFDNWTSKLRKRNPHALSRFDSKGPASSDNPFQRFWIEVDSGLDTLPAITLIELKTTTELDLNGTLIVACQHFLRETCAWFAHLMSKGATIIAIGKDYSTCPEVARRLQRIGVTVVESPVWEWKPGEYAAHLEAKAKLAWTEASKEIMHGAFKEVIVIDDGGVLHKTAGEFFDTNIVPKWCGVEQTTSGEAYAKSAPYPVALVSRQQEKRKMESRVIADKIFDNSLRLCAPLSGTNKRIGIIGAGAIANAVAKRYSDDGYSVFWFSNEGSLTGNKVHYKQTLKELLAATDVIFGCAGRDVLSSFLREPHSQEVVAGKWFISCSSGDTEFASLLKLHEGGKPLCTPLRLHNPFSTMVIQTKPAPCFVLNGGFPINFDRERDSVPLHLIQFTRGLMHLGLIRARAQEIKETGEFDAADFRWGDLPKREKNNAVPGR